MSRFAAWAVRAGRRRWLALLLLATVSLPIALYERSPERSPFKRARNAQFDLYQTMMPRVARSGPVTIVAVDEKALRKLGQWPWPRTHIARLIEHIGAQGALAIGLDMLLLERDQTSPESLAARLGADQAEVRTALARMASYDDLLAQTLARHPVVLGAAGSDEPLPTASGGLRTWPVVTRGPDITRAVHNYPFVLSSLASLQGAASGQGLMNAELERGVVRRVGLASAIGATLVPALSLELLRVATRAAPIEFHADQRGVTAVQVGSLRIPTQPNGEVWLHFSAPRPERYVSAAEVLETQATAEAFKDKVVIVALTGVVGIDSKTTPLGEAVPGAEVHAQLIESFYDGRFLVRPPWMSWLEVAILITFGCALIWIAPRMRRDPAILLAVGLLALVFAFGVALFRWTGLLFDAFSLIIALTTVFSSVIASALVRADHERRATERSLQAARESAARVAGELEAARRIQLGILPSAAASFPAERRFELAAALEPARAVGGDLYDFFMLDANRLFVLIGDVSGKGIPASLLMSIAKALAKSIALRPGGDASHVLSQANVEVSRDNPESQFITAFAAVLDIESGLLRYWTAGHDTPFLRGREHARQIDRALAGPPLCVLDQFDYREQQLRLERGESLTLFTDGITEAENASGEQFGKQRLAQCLERLPMETSAADMLEALRSAVAAFVGGAQASDDLTLVIVRWMGPELARVSRPAAA